MMMMMMHTVMSQAVVALIFFYGRTSVVDAQVNVLINNKITNSCLEWPTDFKDQVLPIALSYGTWDLDILEQKWKEANPETTIFSADGSFIFQQFRPTNDLNATYCLTYN